MRFQTFTRRQIHGDRTELLQFGPEHYRKAGIPYAPFGGMPVLEAYEIRATVESADWNGLLNPSLRFADQSIEEKQKWNRTFGDFTLRFGKGFSLPSGLNPGESLSLLLSRATMAYSGVRDFDQLPIPFRCVATDLVSGDSVVFSRG